MHVIHANGLVEEVEGAETGAVEGDHLVCRDASGKTVKAFDHLDVLMYGSLESLKHHLGDDFVNEPSVGDTEASNATLT